MKKRFVRSWDVFDTLIARRCVYPGAIFDQMNALLGDSFKASRVLAEKTAREEKCEISLDDIYCKLQMLNGWDSQQRENAKNLEIRTEFENVIPINENLSRVCDGDILVSDMYLSCEIIMKLLRSAGLDKEVTLFVSSNGKADGSMWKRLKSQFYIIKHTGDNPISDFLRPIFHRIPASLTDASDETEWELLLRRNGAPFISAFVRESRLRVYDKNKNLHRAQKAQVEANFPFLLLASAALVNWCEENKISRALMSSRDCILWVKVAQKIVNYKASTLEVEYFYISRVTALEPSDHYLNYASKRLKSNTVVVDLSMTGVSLAVLAERLGLKEVLSYVISWQGHIAKSLYGDKYSRNVKINVEYITSGVIREDVEAVNQAKTPSIHDVQEINDHLSITYASDNRSSNFLKEVDVQHIAFIDMLNRSEAVVLNEALVLGKSTRLAFLIRECARHISKFDTLIARTRRLDPWNDPNELKLKLHSYREAHRYSTFFFNLIKKLIKIAIPEGEFLRKFKKIVIAISQLQVRFRFKN
jgi:hypothetical protein